LTMQCQQHQSQDQRHKNPSVAPTVREWRMDSPIGPSASYLGPEAQAQAQAQSWAFLFLASRSLFTNSRLVSTRPVQPPTTPANGPVKQIKLRWWGCSWV
jgi:hypothetical protein